MTDAEARTIAVFLGSAAGPERERLSRSGLPRSTYHAARRRAYDEGWLRDRYVPEPQRFGLPFAVFIAARPFVDQAESLISAWSEDPGLVALWGGPAAVLGTFFRKSSSEALALARGTTWGPKVSSSTPVVADLRVPSVPVYFDFEGLWAHLAGLDGTIAYPRGLGGSSAEPDGGAAAISSHTRWAAAELVARPFAVEKSGGRLIGPLGLPFSQRRLVAKGWVTHRVFLDPSRLAAYRGNAADSYVLITGTPRPSLRPEQLFQTLVRESRVFPFLYVVSPTRLLIGALGSSNRSYGPAATERGASRRSVISVLNEALSDIAIFEQPASALPVLVDHRYDRLLPQTSNGHA